MDYGGFCYFIWSKSSRWKQCRNTYFKPARTLPDGCIDRSHSQSIFYIRANPASKSGVYIGRSYFVFASGLHIQKFMHLERRNGSGRGDEALLSSHGFGSPGHCETSKQRPERIRNLVLAASRRVAQQIRRLNCLCKHESGFMLRPEAGGTPAYETCFARFSCRFSENHARWFRLA